MSLIERYHMDTTYGRSSVENFYNTLKELKIDGLSDLNMSYTNEMYQSGYLTIYDGTYSNGSRKKLCEIYVGIENYSSYRNKDYLYIKAYGDDSNYICNAIGTEINDQNTEYNVINDVIVGQYFVAFNLLRRSDRTNKCGAVIVFTKTNKNKTCIIMPSYKYKKQDYDNNDIAYPVYLSAITNNTRTDYHSYIKYVATPASSTMFTPVLVNGDDDYCPHVFYTPSTDILLDQSDDGIIDYNGKHYWYNGFIAVEI